MVKTVKMCNLDPFNFAGCRARTLHFITSSRSSSITRAAPSAAQSPGTGAGTFKIGVETVSSSFIIRAAPSAETVPPSSPFAAQSPGTGAGTFQITAETEPFTVRRSSAESWSAPSTARRSIVHSGSASAPGRSIGAALRTGFSKLFCGTKTKCKKQIFVLVPFITFSC